jgi:hypothetical protein
MALGSFVEAPAPGTTNPILVSRDVRTHGALAMVFSRSMSDRSAAAAVEAAGDCEIIGMFVIAP